MKLEDAILKELCPSLFLVQICCRVRQRVSVINAGAMEKGRLSITFYATALKSLSRLSNLSKKSDKRMADGWVPAGSGFKTQTCVVYSFVKTSC